METTYEFDEHYRKLLTNLLGDIEPASLAQIFESSKKVQLEPGEYLLNQGESQNELYIVLKGRLRALVQDQHGTSILGDVAEGEPVGEMALFTSEPRMAAVVALRKSLVLEISKTDYHAVVAKNPEFATALTRFVIKRLKRNVLQQNIQAAPKNIAIVPLQTDLDLDFWLDAVQKSLDSASFPAHIMKKTSAQGSSQDLFETLELQKGINLMCCDQKDPKWSHQCLLHADLVLVISDFGAQSDLYPIEKELSLYEQHILHKKTYLLLLHKQDAALPENTKKWFQNRNLHLHIHVRRQNERDLRRLARILTNNAVGLVLGGLGIKGYAHVGALKALLEAGMEVDFVGGTGAGALYGTGMTFSDFDFDRIHGICKNIAESEWALNDYFQSIFSLNKGNQMDNQLRSIFGNANLEDIWVNTYCVSSNATNTEVKVHNNGPVQEKVQASFVLPGTFPPVVIDDQVYLDGGSSDNLPIDPMYLYPVKNIIAISISGAGSQQVDFRKNPSAWEKIKGNFSKKKKYDNPVVTTVMVNSMTFNSRQKEEITKSKVSLYFEINLRAVSMLEDSKWEKVVKKGHEQAKDYLAQLTIEDKFWM